MKITFARLYGEYIVTVEGRYFAFDNTLDALKFIFNIRKETV